MKDMVTQEAPNCPFEFNFDEATFKIGDLVSYRVEGMEDFPFVGTLTEVGSDFVMLCADPSKPEELYRGTRASRPLVSADQVK